MGPVLLKKVLVISQGYHLMTSTQPRYKLSTRFDLQSEDSGSRDFQGSKVSSCFYFGCVGLMKWYCRYQLVKIPTS